MAQDNVSPHVARNARPYLHGPEIDAVAHVLGEGHYGHTRVTEEFEQGVAGHLGVPAAVAVATGTAALHIALRLAGIGPGHEVIVPSMTFCATVQAILAVGARPRFAEVSPETLCVTSQAIREALTPATRAVIPVLYGGRAVDLADVADELAERRVTVVEDAAQAFGSRHGSVSGTPHVGATGALTCFSFGPIKALTCGQGGMIIPRDPAEAAAARRLRGLGIVQSAAERAAATTYTVDGFGYRLEMSAINAAIGIVQLPRFADVATRRKALWRAYADALAGADGVSVVDVDVEHSVPSMCVVRVHDRDRVFAAMSERGVGVGVHYPPNHLQPAFAAWRRSLPVTERLGEQILTLPFHPRVSEHDARYVAEAVKLAST